LAFIACIYAALIIGAPPDKAPMETFRIPLAEPVYTPVSMASANKAFYVLDDREFVLAKIDKDGDLVAKTGRRGQGPGEFMSPYSVGVDQTEKRVFVGDLNQVSVFNGYDLSYIGRFDLFNNTMEIEVLDNELFLGTTRYPKGTHSCYVFSFEGKELRSFYDHNTDPDELNLAYFDISGKAIYFLHQQYYRVDITDPFGRKLKEVAIQPSPLYREVVPIEPYNKKYGPTLAAYKHWQTAWSMSQGIAVEKDRYLWLCFSEMANDLKSTNYFVEIYDLESGRKIVSWQKMPGRLYDGGDRAYFIIEEDGGTNTGEDLFIAGFNVSSK